MVADIVQTVIHKHSPAISWRQRGKFWGWHMAVSVLSLVLIAGCVYGRWYPGALAELHGVHLIMLLFAVASIGCWPFLTALVIKTDKKEQRRDHAILWTLQAAFTLACLYFLYHSRPVWLVYSADLFEIIRKKDVVYSNNVPLRGEWQVGIWSQPKWLGAAFSTDKTLEAKQRNEDLDGVPLARRVDALVAIREKQTFLQRYANPVATLADFNTQAEIEQALQAYPRASHWFPIKGFVRDAVVLTDVDFSFFSIVLLQPWETDE